MRKYFIIATPLMIVFILAITFAQTPTSPPLGSSKKPIAITFDPYGGEVDKLWDFSNELLRLLEQKTGLKYNARIFFGSWVASAVEGMGRNFAEIGWLTPFSYLAANKNYGVSLGLEVVRENKDYTNGEIITHKNSGIKTLADLKGKTFCMVSPSSTLGYITQKLVMKANGIDPEKDLKNMKQVFGHRPVVITVYKGDCDFGATYVDARTDPAYGIPKEFPDVMDKVIRLNISINIPNEAICFTKNFPADLKKKISQALLDIARTPEGAKILASHPLPIGGFKLRDDSYYNDLRALFANAGEDPKKYIPEEIPES